MPIEEALADETTGATLFVGTDGLIELVNYTDTTKAVVKEITGWTIVLDIRKKDTSAVSLLSKTGVVSGTFNSAPGSNTQKVTWTLSDDDLAATIFAGDDIQRRYSIKRTDPGSEHILRYGDVTITRVTQT